jgi:hypothetical protein
MQRGLRVNRDSKDLWLAYFKLELDCLSKVKAQRALLGISASPDDTSSSEPSVVGIPGSSEAPLAAEADVLAAAESDFLKGAVARIVHAHAVKEIPNDVEFELRFAEVAAQARDTSTKESRVARALLVPSLLDDIVLRCKARYPEVPTNDLCTWIVLCLKVGVVVVVVVVGRSGASAVGVFGNACNQCPLDSATHRPHAIQEEATGKQRCGR